MDYCIVEDGIITNMVVLSDSTSPDENMYPAYASAKIGDPYSPPDRLALLETENALLKAQLQAQTERSDFIEDCIAEMATQVYAQ